MEDSYHAFKTIAEGLEVEGPSLIPIIDKMEKEGFVKRKVDHVDRRISRISLTTNTDATWNSLADWSMQDSLLTFTYW